MIKKEGSILAIQGQLDPRRDAEQKVIEPIFAQAEVPTDFVDALAENEIEEIDWNDPDRILEGHIGLYLGGSGFIDLSHLNPQTKEGQQANRYLNRVIPVVQLAMDRGLSIHGTCVGHHAMAIATSGESIVQRLPEVAEVDVVNFTLSPLGQRHPHFEGRQGNSMYTVGVHNDSLGAHPKGSEVVGRTQRDPRSFLQYNDGRATSSQLHFEISDATHLLHAIRTVNTVRSQLPSYDAPSSFRQPDDGRFVLVNFARRAKALSVTS
jgi:GMP synthase-like glutamine amidotransferase